MRDSDEVAAISPPVSIRKRLLVRGGAFVLVLVLLYLGYDYLQRTRAGNALERAMAKLDESDPGWRWEDIEAARPTIPDEPNSARTAMNAHRLLTTGSANLETMLKIENPRLPERLDAERLAELERALKADEAAVAEARKLADMPRGRHRIAWKSNPYLTMLPDIQNTRASFVLMRCDALYLAQKGKPAEALRSCRALLNAARSLDDEPLVIVQCVRMQGAGLFSRAVERTLALGECTDRDLGVLAQRVEEEEAHPGLRVALRGERAALHVFLTGVADGSFTMTEMMEDESYWFEFREEYAGWTVRSLARQEHALMLALMTRAIDNTRLPYHEQRAAEYELNNQIQKLSGTDSLNKVLIPRSFGWSSSMASYQCDKVARMRCLRVLLAVERHRLQKGAWPEKLEELTPQLLKAVPLDPFDGRPLGYKRLPDGVVVFSVGDDLTDDGSDIERPPGGWTHRLGYRLWDVKHRRQSPTPKTPPVPPGGIPGPPGAKR
jgi:hypothetical protein